MWLAARTFRARARRSPGAWLKYRGENSMEADVVLADPGGMKRHAIELTLRYPLEVVDEEAVVGRWFSTPLPRPTA